MSRIGSFTSVRRASSFATIYLSKSSCIYENLAFEEWLFRNHNLEKYGEAMLLWSNRPAVVIGRHQNPWIEANFQYCQNNAIDIARRHSGGGTVYHDLGNLNISILTTQTRHNRQRNLQLISDYINKALGIECFPTPRDDLCIQGGCKISGTAARIAKNRAYHHFSLLVDVCIDRLKTSLHSKLKNKIQTNATQSIRAKFVGCLAQKIPAIQVQDVLEIVSLAFKSQFSTCQIIDLDEDLKTNDEKYVGLHENYEQLKSREWIYGKTPKFELNFLGLYPHTANTLRAEDDCSFKIIVERGIVRESQHPGFREGEPFYDSVISTGLCKL